MGLPVRCVSLKVYGHAQITNTFIKKDKELELPSTIFNLTRIKNIIVDLKLQQFIMWD